MADLVERLRGPVREAASRLIAGSFRRDGERLDEKRPRFSIPARPDEDDDLVLIAALEEAAAALEASESAGGRKGLGEPVAWRWREKGSRTWQVADVPPDRSDYWHNEIVPLYPALIPEAPAQPELASSAANQISTAEIGLPEAPAREGWQPIETAPKDQTPVLVFVPDARKSKVLSGNCGVSGNGKLLWVIDGRFSFDIGGEPTHWRPLPPPPSQDREPDSQRGAE